MNPVISPGGRHDSAFIDQRERGVVASLRDTVPLRPLTYTESLRIAELQAARFLNFVGVHEPAVPERVITELPKIQVTR